MKLPRPPKKKTRVIAKARREGELKAEAEHEYKSIKFIADMLPFMPEKYKKNAVLWMKNLLEKHLDKMPKMVAVLGLTWMIKFTIDWTQGVFKRALERATKMPIPFGLGQVAFEQMPHGRPAIKIGDDTEWQEWLISYVVAYIIIEHGGEIALGLGESFKNLSMIAGFLLG